MNNEIVFDPESPNTATCNGRKVEFASFAQWCGDNGKDPTPETADALRKQWVEETREKAQEYFSR